MYFKKIKIKIISLFLNNRNNNLCIKKIRSKQIYKEFILSTLQFPYF